MTDFDADRWQALSETLDEILDADPSDCEARLAAVDARDPALASQLRGLVRRHDMVVAERFLEHGPAGWRTTESLTGQEVGVYRVISLIGRGGMGSVWLAERADGRFERRTAIKFLNVALAGRGEHRFRREGRILARLSHPHIASLIDAGVTPDGEPYLVLEFVDGEAIDRFCDRERLDVNARIRLFLDVLDAVAHAHANLIVHRDLKPSNVLVAQQSGVKLLDFGIAKLLEADGDEAAVALTRDIPLTPNFAAPEQLTGGPITAATDVYALGVLLFLLLTGRHPAASAGGSFVDLMKAVVEKEAPRPSEAIAGDAAPACRSTPERLRRTLRGDLDTIIVKTLKRDAAQRYASVSALAEDLRRYLNHEPVRARPDTLAYRAVRFTRRHRAGMAAAALVFVMLAGGLYAINRERLIAERRFTVVREIATRLFDVDVQVRQLSGSSKARQVIVDAALDYLRRLTPDAQGDLQLTLELGTAYMRVARVQGVPISANLGQIDQAQENERRAEALVDSVLAKQPNNRSAILRRAQIAHDRMILAGIAGHPDQAVDFARRSAERLDRYLGAGEVIPADAEQVVITGMNVANRYRQAEQFDDAIRLSRRTIEIAKATRQPAQAAAASMVLALAFREQGDLENAWRAAHEAAAGLEPTPGQTAIGRRLSFALALTREGQILGERDAVSLGRGDDAVPVLERAFTIVDEIAAEDEGEANSRERLVTAALTLAGIVRDRNPERALQLYDTILERLAHVGAGNIRFKRDQVLALAGSSYALRSLQRAGDARKRVDDAMARLMALHAYPSDRIEPGSETDLALRARADDEADRGNLAAAIEIYRDLLGRVDATGPRPETNLADANDLSCLYAALAALYQRKGLAADASALDARRLALWRHWDERLPANSFVRRQIAAVGPR